MIRGRGNLSAADKLELSRQVEDIILSRSKVSQSVFTACRQRERWRRTHRPPAPGSIIPKDIIGQITVELLPFEERRLGR